MNRAPLHCVCFLCLLTFGVFHQAGAVDHNEGFNPVSVTARYEKSFKENEGLQKLFRKYGKDGNISFKGFKKLLGRLGLGEVRIAYHEELIGDHEEDSNGTSLLIVDTIGGTNHVHYPHTNDVLCNDHHSGYHGEDQNEDTGAGHQDPDHSDHSHESTMSGEANGYRHEESTDPIKQVPQSPTSTVAPEPAAVQEAPTPRPGRHGSSRRQGKKGKKGKRRRGRKSTAVRPTRGLDLMQVATESPRRVPRDANSTTGSKEDPKRHDGHDEHEEGDEHGHGEQDHDHGHNHEGHSHGHEDHDHEDHAHADRAHEDHGHEDHDHEDHGHEDHDHEDHGHEDHDHEDHAHEDRAHEDHGHEDHDHEDHAHEDHDHEDHGHEDHDHEDHGHEDHDHEDHGHEDHDHEDHAHEDRAHEDHGHEDHDHEDHGHEDHDHKDHAHEDRAHEDHGHEDHDHEDHVHEDREHEDHAHEDHVHEDHGHEDHDHEDHVHEDREHEDHAHEDHDHEDHGHEDHDHEDHIHEDREHEDHAHEDHVHEDHGHEDYDHEDHAHEDREHEDHVHEDHGHEDHDQEDHAHEDHEHEDHAHEDHDHEDHAHEDHGHEDHGPEDCAHEDHGHEDHDHEDHGHEDHDQEDHGHEDHDHEEHVHEDHAHEDHGHEDHGPEDRTHEDHGPEDRAHEDHAHEDHDHEDHGHEDHDHEDHGQEDHDQEDHAHEDHDHEDHGPEEQDHGPEDHNHGNEDHDDGNENHGRGHDHPEHAPGAHCLSAREILVEYNIPPDMSRMTMPDFVNICPLLIAQIDEQACIIHEEDGHDHDDHDEHKGTAQGVPAAVWGYGILAVTVISMLAVVGIVLLPLMDQRVYQFVLCFLIALAMGTLTGDAVLHLLPHALGLHSHAGEDSHEGHEGHDEGHDEGSHLDPVLKGLTVLFGIYFLFMMEKLMGVMTKRRAKRKAKKLRKQKELAHPEESYELHTVTDSPIEDDHCHHHHHHHHLHDNEKLKDPGIATMAWMVIMGDGLHNLSDGLAIGAAFASSIPGGISTSIAIFCHELPHELGDFALLIRAGMSVKQAILYNLMSACVCYIGLLIGLGIGNLSGNVIQYVFAVTTGMFLYVGLVDMLPDMVHPNQPQVVAKHDHREHGHSHDHSDVSHDNLKKKKTKSQGPAYPVLVQSFGVLVGIGIMLLIAVYESKIKI
ncbi:uncharacterized protein LOC144862865 isoform X1 [Branchiostoma floridae x Branchiostoma japonicum]